jgi:iron complex outermembrane receptor protein
MERKTQKSRPGWLIMVFLFVCLMLNSYQTLLALEELKPEDVFKMSLEELSNIEVASTFSESELSVGSTVHIVTKTHWEKYGSKNLLESIRSVPSFFPLPNTFGSAISVRGYTNNLSVRGIAHLVDGIPVNNLSDATSNYEHPFYELGALKEIEIISGPGSSIYGSDAFHGVLSLKTFESRSDRLSVSLEGGSDMFHRANIKISRGLGKNVRIHTAAAISRQPDQGITFYYTHPFTKKPQAAERKNSYTSAAGLFKLDARLKPTIRGHFGLYYSYWKSDEFPSAGRFFGSGLSILQDRDVSGNDAGFCMAKGGLRFDLSHRLELSVETYFWRSSLTRYLDRRRLPPPLNSDISHDTKDDRKLGIDITLKQDKNRWNTQWLLRYQYNKSRVAEDSFEDIDPISGAIVNSGIANADGYRRFLNSLVFQAKTGFFKNHAYLLYGGRLDRYSDFGTQLTPRLGLIYQPNPKSALKFLYGRAFRAPTPNEALGSGLVKSNRDLEPEIIDSFEFVFIRHWKTARISFTMFRNEWSYGIQVDAIDEPPYNLQYKNTGKNKSAGMELALNIDFSPFLFDLSGSVVESKDLIHDRKYLAFPKYILNVGIGYFLKSYNTRVYITNRMFSRAHAGPVTVFEPEPPRLPLYFRTDLTIQWRATGKLSIRLTCRNLFNKDNVLPSVWSVENGIPGESFNLSMGLSYLF